MKIICDQSELLKGINIASKAIPSKTTLSVLECFLIVAKDSKISFAANDMEMCIETVIEGDIREEGSICINAKLLSDIVRKLPDGDVVIETDNQLNVKIEGEKSKFNISGRDGLEFPKLPEVEEDKYFVITNYLLREIIRKTVFSISDNESNRVMTGELFKIDGSLLTVVGLDGHRFALVKQDLGKEFGQFSAIVPGKTLNEIVKIYQSEKGESSELTTVYVTDKHMMFKSKDTVIVTRLIEGTFWNYELMILNGEYDTVIKINKKEFLDSIDRASLLIRESERRPVVIAINEDNIELKINSSIGSMHEVVPVEMEGNEFIIGFNPKFIMDALRVIEDETIELCLVNQKCPMKIANKEETYMYIILPVGIGSSTI